MKHLCFRKRYITLLSLASPTRSSRYMDDCASMRVCSTKSVFLEYSSMPVILDRFSHRSLTVFHILLTTLLDKSGTVRQTFIYSQTFTLLCTCSYNCYIDLKLSTVVTNNVTWLHNNTVILPEDKLKMQRSFQRVKPYR